VPLLLGFVPGLRLPAVVLEIVAGIVLGPSGLGWIELDAPIEILALLGLAFLLFLAGLEIELDKLRGRLLRVALLGLVASFAIGLGVGGGLAGFDLVDSPLLIAIILMATSLGVVVPVLKDAGLVESAFGQLVIAASTVADFASVILLSLLFSREATGPGAQLVLLGSFVLVMLAVAGLLIEAEHWGRLSAVLRRLQDTTAQIRVRGAFLLLVGFAAVAERLGLETILAAFLAGVVLGAVDRDRAMTHPEFRRKLEAAGFGIFIPIFFVASGLRFDLDALFGSGSALARVPLFLVCLLAVRGLPALLYRPLIGGRQALVAGLLQATSLPFIVAASNIGLELGELDEATAAGLIAAGLLSVLLFPLGALALLGNERAARTEPVEMAPAEAM
jgi:Kef-type K+ transport system membrane component KefB